MEIRRYAFTCFLIALSLAFILYQYEEVSKNNISRGWSFLLLMIAPIAYIILRDPRDNELYKTAVAYIAFPASFLIASLLTFMREGANDFGIFILMAAMPILLAMSAFTVGLGHYINSTENRTGKMVAGSALLIALILIGGRILGLF